MRKIFFYFLLVLILIMVNSCSGLATSANPKLRLKQSDRFINGEKYVHRLDPLNYDAALESRNGGGSWTFMVYLDADTNLEESEIDAFLYMSSVGSTSQVNIVVQMDRISSTEDWDDDRYGDWADCKRFNVTQGLTPTPGNAMEDLGEVNMGDPDTLTDFVNWAISSFPAESYCLVLEDHGSGSVSGVCVDETSGGDWLSLPDLSQALSGVTEKMDLLYFDACLMGMVEVAYQISDYVDVMVASEEVGWTGEPFDYYLANLAANPSMSASELADVIVSNYIEYTTETFPLSTMAGVDLSQISSLKTAVDNLAQSLNDAESIYNDEIRSAEMQAEGYMGPFGGMYGWYIDLYHFAQLIHQNIPDDDIRNDAEQVMTALSNAVIVKDHYSHPNSHGLSIFFPCTATYPYTTLMTEYLKTDFSEDTMWDEFIDYHLSIAPAKPDLMVVYVQWTPFNPMPGEEVIFYAGLANQGTQDATSVYLRAYKDGSLYASGTFSFSAGTLRELQVTSTWTATAGNHNITWNMDPYEDIEEWNETNNEMTKSFTVGYKLTVQTPYSDITVKIDGDFFWTDTDGNVQTYVSPGSHSVEVQDPISIGTGIRGVFLQWEDGNLSNPRDVFVENDLTLTAPYVTQYRLFVDRNPYNVGEVSGEDWYDQGTIAVATCTSIANETLISRYVFVDWTGDASGTSTTLEILMDGPKTVMANYWRQYTVTFEKSGSGESPHATVDGTEYQLPYSLWLDEDSSHTFSYESPVNGGTGMQYVLSYTSSTSPFDVSYAMTITGYYTTQFWLQVTTSVSGVTVPGTGWHDSGTSVICTAQTVSGYTFDHWIIDGISQQNGLNPIVVTMNGPHEVAAQYVAESTPDSGGDSGGSSDTGSSTDYARPSIGEAAHEPDSPMPRESITVSVDVTDDLSGVAQVTLHYRTDTSTSWIEVDMEKLTGDTYVGDIPGFDEGTVIQYYVTAYDNAGNDAIQDAAGECYSCTVVPEFSDLTIVGLFMLVTLVAVALAKRRHKATRKPIIIACKSSSTT